MTTRKGRVVSAVFQFSEDEADPKITNLGNAINEQATILGFQSNGSGDTQHILVIATHQVENN